MVLESKKIIIKSAILVTKISLAIIGDVTSIYYYSSTQFYSKELKTLMLVALFSGFSVQFMAWSTLLPKLNSEQLETDNSKVRSAQTTLEYILALLQMKVFSSLNNILYTIKYLPQSLMIAIL